MNAPLDLGAARPNLDPSRTDLASRLARVAHNLHWAWDMETQAFFRDLFADRWQDAMHSPAVALARASHDELERIANDPVVLGQLEQCERRLARYLSGRDSWGESHAAMLSPRPVAYFSMEFGLHESLPIYSGGLGILAGDHLKSASDLGVPLVAVGLFYREGYFRQQIDAEGSQQAAYVDVPLEGLPLTPILDAKGAPLTIQVDTRKDPIHARIWRADVGRVALYLLDTDLPANGDKDRGLTAHLYGGDERRRIRQEIVLGIGGLRALAAMGIAPSVLHMNEGHCAFAALEQLRLAVTEEGLSVDAAIAQVRQHAVFTTHTPVPAGHDRFDAALVDEHIGGIGDAMGLSADALMGLGRVQPDAASETFCMTVLALKLAGRTNGVSALHGQVSRKMWQPLWPTRPVEEVPIGHITNGVHGPSWIADAMQGLYDLRLGPQWRRRMDEAAVWAPIRDVADGEIWATRQSLKDDLAAVMTERSRARAVRLGLEVPPASRLRREALVIGFARRFATYKRATLVLADEKRLERLLCDPSRPVQLVFAGKAHPRDVGGQDLIRRVNELLADARFRDRIFFIENYDMAVGRALVQGVDVWLNNPRRPMEASGTSGQKVALNGGLNCSILDGWWAEAYDGHNGFAIGRGLTHTDWEIQDGRDAEDLYRTLLDEVVPLYFDRDESGLPRGFIARTKEAIATLGWRFCSDRMVHDYARNCYLPAAGCVPNDFAFAR